MCGIVGLVDYKSSPDMGRVRAATDTLIKRGPDKGDVWGEGPAALGHRRLSILDLSPSGGQPMKSQNGRYVITHNGEIYNFKELRSELADIQMDWRSQTDTEVILAAYRKWGTDCVNHFNGMFAFAIWDRQEKTLFLARDRMGVKPLYYHVSSECFAFGSRPKALLALCGYLSQDIDAQALRYYLELGYIPAPLSYHAGMRKLPPGHWLMLRGQEVQVNRYWDLRSIQTDMSWSARKEDDLLDELDELLSRSVRLRMVSDVPLGVFLSGGIDSSLVIHKVASHATQAVKAFTIGFEDKHYDESNQAAALAVHVHAEHHCETLRASDLLELLPTFLSEYDEPFFDHSAIATLAVSRLARKDVTVALSGDGGDELFGGYHYYRLLGHCQSLSRSPAWLRRLLSNALKRAPMHGANLMGAAIDQENLYGSFAFLRSIRKDFPQVLNKDIVQKTRGAFELFESAAMLLPSKLSVGEKAMRLDQAYTLSDDYLQKVDVASMAFSLECREPLLSHELLEWACKLPLSWKIRGGQGKYLLRRLAQRHFPAHLVMPGKHGFELPMAEWLRNELRPEAAELFRDPESFKSLPLDQSQVLKLFDLHLSGKRNVSPLLWAIFVLLRFQKTRNGCTVN
jgi:asparagine synthase (glutamine-hydrolysing)